MLVYVNQINTNREKQYLFNDLTCKKEGTNSDIFFFIRNMSVEIFSYFYSNNITQWCLSMGQNCNVWGTQSN